MRAKNRDTHKPDTITTIGLDLSLTSTGYARITWHPNTSNTHTIDLQTITSRPNTGTLAGRNHRLTALRTGIVTLCRGADLTLVEGPSFSRNNAGTWDRAGLWWHVISELHRLNIPVAEAPPTTVKKFACGRGNGTKVDVAAGITRMWPDEHPHGDDQFDALALASAALLLATSDQHHNQLPFRVLERHRAALDRVSLPASPHQ